MAITDRSPADSVALDGRSQHRLTSGHLPAGRRGLSSAAAAGISARRLRHPRHGGRRRVQRRRLRRHHGDPLPRADHRHLERSSRAAQGRRPACHGRRHRGLPHRDGPAHLCRVDGAGQRRRRPDGRVLHELDAQRRRRGRRRAPRHRRHDPHHRSPPRSSRSRSGSSPRSTSSSTARASGSRAASRSSSTS